VQRLRCAARRSADCRDERLLFFRGVALRRSAMLLAGSEEMPRCNVF